MVGGGEEPISHTPAANDCEIGACDSQIGARPEAVEDCDAGRISPGKDCEIAVEHDLQNENEKPGAWKPEKGCGIGVESDPQIENEDEDEKTGIVRWSRRLRERLADSDRDSARRRWRRRTTRAPRGSGRGTARGRRRSEC